MEQLRSNHKIELAREFILNTRANIFLTGKAGTGKTTMLRGVVASLGKRAVIAAPTGVAALNAGGVTLHSLFQLPFGPYIPGSSVATRRISKSKLALIRSIELLIIDEVSMVRSDLLDAIDQTLRSIRRSSRPFAGVQLLLIGDIQQLAPICKDEEWDLLKEHYSTQYFFDSKALQRSPYVTIEFDEIFRQSDSHFTDILNAIRENRATTEILEELNRRYIPNFDPSPEQDYIILTTHNNNANSINRRKLAELKGVSKRYEAAVSGNFSESAYPNETDLELKVGAQVLFIKNDISPQKRYYNGLIGKVVKVDEKRVTVQPKSGGEPITVESMLWESIEYNVNTESGEMEQNITGSFRQMPLKCAWAITIHKSQGLSFDRAIIDASTAFAHGQVYVALSRCRSLEGLVLQRPITPSSIIGEENIDRYSAYVTRNQPSEEMLWAYKRENFSELLCEIFSFEVLQRLLWDLMSELSGPLSRAYPKLTASLMEFLSSFDREIVKVGESFQKQLRSAIYKSDNYESDSFIAERLSRAADYFTPRLAPIDQIAKVLGRVEPDSADVRRRIADFTQRLKSLISLLNCSLGLCSEGFSIERYQSERAKILALQSLGQEAEKRSSTKSTSATQTKSKAATKAADFSDIANPVLYDTLAAWRREEAAEIEKPAFVILSNKTLIQIQAELPKTPDELSKIVGMGKVKMERYSDQILDIVNDYCFSKS
ncbi:MAG: AAA family ATPase [Rikenellaceae bacterium]